MKKVFKITLIATLLTPSLFAHGQPDNPLGMTTMVTLAPTVYVSNASSHAKGARGQRKAEAQEFIENNRESLEVEVAQGEGEKLDTLATLYKVEDKKEWRSGLQENYEKIFYKKDEPKSSFEVTGELTLFVEKYFK